LFGRPERTWGVSEDRMARRPASKQAPKPASDKAELLAFYRSMLLIRRFEERAGQLYGMGLIGGFCHLYIGQEAIAVGMQSVKKPGDQVITGYREHGHMLAAGMDPKSVMAELTGRAAGAVGAIEGALALERVGRQRRAQRLRAVLQREREQHECEEHRDERGAVDARVDHQRCHTIGDGGSCSSHPSRR